MALTAKKKKRIAFAAGLLALFLVANFYTVRKAAFFGIELFCYDKLLVAYQVGGTSGMDSELARILTLDESRHERAVAEKFSKELSGMKDPAEFLKDAVEEKKEKIRLMRNLRVASFGFIALLLFLRLLLKIDK